MKQKNKFSFQQESINFLGQNYFDYSSAQFDAKLNRAATDIPASLKTTAQVTLNQSFISAIDKAGDIDWIKVNLTAGHNYQINLNGLDTNQGTLSDPVIKGIYNNKGISLGPSYSDDDSGEGRNSLLTFTPSSSGTYYIALAGYGNTKGTYSFVINEDLTAPTLTSIQPNNSSSNVSSTTNIVAQFSENIIASSGSIHIVGNDGHQIDILASDITQVQIAGHQATINPLEDLHEGVSYNVSFDTNCFKDMSGNGFLSSNSDVFTFVTAVNSNVPPVKSDWTVMVYMAADNNLESYALLDLNELEQVGNLSGLSITTLVDRSSTYSTDDGNWSDTRVGAIEFDSSSSFVSLSAENSWGELDTGNTQTLTDFILWSVANRPAENYALVIWNHGGGIDGIAWDDSSGGYLSMNEVSKSIDDAINFSSSDSLDKFGLIAMDACLMGMLEVAYPLNSYADYLVLSEELVPGTGFAYDNWLNIFSTPEVSALELGQSALNSYSNEYVGASDITLSNIDMSYMAGLLEELNQFTNIAISAGSRDLRAVSKSVASARDFPSDQSYDYADLGHTMDLISANNGIKNLALKSAASRVSDALDLLINDDVGTVSQASGLSIYMPYGNEVVSSSYNLTNIGFLQAVPLWDDFLNLI
jgi:methionine-rich copper-binding protein CopC